MSIPKPLLNRIIIVRDAAPEKTSSGLFIPSNAALEQSNTGTVVSIGNGLHDNRGNVIDAGVKVNDRVLFVRNAGQNLEVDGKEFLLLSPHDILAVINT